MRTIHMAVDIAGVLTWPLAELSAIFLDDTGKHRPGAEVRAWLEAEWDAGKRKLPIGKACEGWSDSTGCPGHQQQEEEP